MDFEKFKQEKLEKERRRKERERLKKEREKKKEQERLKKERKKAKREANRPMRQKLLKKQQNRRAYLKRKRKLEKERRHSGERKSYFCIYIVRDNVRVKQLGWSLLMSKAYEMFNNAVEENSKISFPLRYVKIDKGAYPGVEVNYEILLTEKVEEITDNPQFRDENGKFTEHVISDLKNRIILEKNVWNVEETFHVYGYNPVRHRKTYDFIKNELVLKKFTNSFDIARIMVWRNKLFIMSSNDFDFVVCKNAKDAARLSDTLEKELSGMKFKNALFMGVVRSAFIAEDLIAKMQEKTGWSRAFCCSLH